MSQPIVIGYDPVESIAYNVLSHSILRRTSYPVTITPVGNTVTPPVIYNRERGPYDSTEFSNARFAAPLLHPNEEFVIFMDCDMLCLADIHYLIEQFDSSKMVQVVKHNHIPKETTKFLGAEQTKYDRKNWSSLMILNNKKILETIPDWQEFIHDADGLDLHQFKWCEDDEIGDIEGGWNHLVGVETTMMGSPLPHFTLGGPWHGYVEQPYAMAWVEEFADMLGKDDNPACSLMQSVRAGKLDFEGAYIKGDE